MVEHRIRRPAALASAAMMAAGLLVAPAATAQTDPRLPGGDPYLSPQETPDSALDSLLQDDEELDGASLRLLSPAERARYRQDMDAAATPAEKREVRETYELLLQRRLRHDR